MRIEITADELTGFMVDTDQSPDHDSDEYALDVPAETAARWLRARIEFERMMREVEEAAKAQGKAGWPLPPHS